ncbi:MAG: hypothetical protein KGM16_13145 [Bacteroidota bacterium]|nr:hypothetical protein [Bacteroidota bacterium]
MTEQSILNYYSKHFKTGKMKMRYLKIFLMVLIVPFIACKKEVKQTNNNQNNNNNNQTGNYLENLLAISKTEKVGSPWVQLNPDTVYTSYNLQEPLVKPLPASYEDKIVSFRLPKGYMAVFAANFDGTGESVCYVALDSAINANLPQRLRNNISYIRYIAIKNPDKKGTASTNDTTVQALGAQWFYGWSLNRASFTGQQFVPMTWGKGACTDDNVRYLIERQDIDHLLSFNEPDNTGQSNIPNIDTAIQRYKIMEKTGLRLGAPATTQNQVFGNGKWLTNFMANAQLQKVRIDFIPIHWYDWGNQTNNGPTDSITAKNIFNRFVTYVQNVHHAYPDQPIWVTEYNANINRTSKVVHEYFMKLSTEWMNSTPYIERYSYFFPDTVPEVNPDFSLTDVGAYWKSLVSTKSFSGNIVSNDTTLN